MIRENILFNTNIIILVLILIVSLIYFNRRAERINLSKIISGLSFGENTAAIENGTKPESHVTNFRIRIPRMRYDPIDRIVQYQIIIKYKRFSWDTWRRYSDFRSLYKRHSIQTTSKFPEKSSTYDVLSGNENTLVFIDKRRKQLESFLNDAIPSAEAFEKLCLFMKNDTDKLGPTGIFFAVPKEISFENVKLNPTKEEILTQGLKSFDILINQLKLVDVSPVQKPWEKLHENKSKEVESHTLQEGDFLHVAVKAKVECKKEELLDMLLDSSMRSEWDDNHEMQQHLEGFLISPPSETVSPERVTPELKEYFKSHSELASTEKEILQKIAGEIKQKYNYNLLLASTQYSRMKSPAPMVVAKRDFVTICLVAQNLENKAAVICLSSVEYNLPGGLEHEAKTGGYVRGKYTCAGTVIKDDGKTRAEMINLTMIDPGTYVPPRIIKMFAPQKANEIPEMATFAKKRSATKPPGASALLSD